MKMVPKKSFHEPIVILARYRNIQNSTAFCLNIVKVCTIREAANPPAREKKRVGPLYKGAAKKYIVIMRSSANFSSAQRNSSKLKQYNQAITRHFAPFVKGADARSLRRGDFCLIQTLQFCQLFLKHLKNASSTHAGTNTHGNHAVLFLHPLQTMNYGSSTNCTSRSKRMAKRYRTTDGVNFSAG